MTTFSELEIGWRFHYGVDADGHEPYLYKVSETEGYVESGSNTGRRETVAPDETVYVWGQPVELHAYMTEVERAALTLLWPPGGPPLAEHIGLWYYIKALAENCDEMRDLDIFIFEQDVPSKWNYDDDDNMVVLETRPLRAVCAQAGAICWRDKLYEHDNSALLNLLDTDDEQDANAVRLADAIHEYRVAGRPVGDQSYTIAGMGSPLARVTTSLAAAIAEYHRRALNDALDRTYTPHALATREVPDAPPSGVTSLRISGLEDDLALLYRAYGSSANSYNSVVRKAIENEAARLRMIQHYPSAE